MGWRFLHFSSTEEPWCTQAFDVYKKKISHLLSFEVSGKKVKKASRDQSPIEKLRAQHEQILSELGTSGYLVLFDVAGKAMTSEAFAKAIQSRFDQRTQDTLFVIGGAYGFAEETLLRANLRVSLGPMTMNHLVASVVALEQIYRALTIVKGLPYHNP